MRLALGMFEKHDRHELSHGILVIYAAEGRATDGALRSACLTCGRGPGKGAREQDLKSETSFRIRIEFGVLKPSAASQNVRVVGQKRPGHAWQPLPHSHHALCHNALGSLEFEVAGVRDMNWAQVRAWYN